MARGRQWCLRGQELDEVCAEGDGVIAVDTPGCFEAEDVVEVDALGAAVDIREVVGTGEAGVMLLEIGGLEIAVGIIDGGDGVSAECFDKTVLMGPVGAFDPPLGLGRSGMDDIDAQSGESPGDVGQAVLGGMIDRAEAVRNFVSVSHTCILQQEVPYGEEARDD